MLLTYALLLGAARADDGHNAAADEPDLSFLEFLGGVDDLAETNPDYLAHVNAPQPPPAPAAKPVATAPPPGPPGAKNDE